MQRLNILIVGLVLALGFVGPVAAQDVTNPSRVQFELDVDHAQIVSYAVDLIDSTGAVLATIDLGKPAGVGGEEVTVSINVQPIAFGHYTGAFRSIATGVTSPDIPGDNEFDRAPGGPTRPRFAEVPLLELEELVWLTTSEVTWLAD